MKILIVSDIHGSYQSAQCIKKLMVETNAKVCCILGDILYHGPRNDLPEGYDPKKVIQELNSMKDQIIAIRGNCDSEVDQMVLQFPIMADYNYILFEDRKVFITHGHLYSVENHPYLNEGDCLLTGHTHVPTANEKEGIYFLNPGSMTLPKENSPRSYGVLDENGFIVYSTDQEILQFIEFKCN